MLYKAIFWSIGMDCIISEPCYKETLLQSNYREMTIMTILQRNNRKMTIYSITLMARTLMAHSPGLARAIVMVPTGHFMFNSPWMAGSILG